MRAMMEYAQHFQRFYQKSLQPQGEALGLSQLEMGVLLFLHNNPELNAARDVVSLRGFAKSNVSAAVERLEREGWLRVEPDPESRRVKRLYLQPGREEALSALAACQERCFAAATEGFAPEELETLKKQFARMDQNIKRALEQMR